MKHHEVFSHFRPYLGTVQAYCQEDFLGTMIRQQFLATLAVWEEPKCIPTDYPTPNEEYFEWIDLLESVVNARGSYSMIDLGAGFGRWAVRAARAVQQFHGSMPCHVTAVEAEPTVYEWMHMHFQD